MQNKERKIFFYMSFSSLLKQYENNAKTCIERYAIPIIYVLIGLKRRERKSECKVLSTRFRGARVFQDLGKKINKGGEEMSRRINGCISCIYLCSSRRHVSSPWP